MITLKLICSLDNSPWEWMDDVTVRCILVTCCCDNIHSQGRLREERCVLFSGSQFEVPVHYGGEGAAAGVWDSQSHNTDIQEAER